MRPFEVALIITLVAWLFVRAFGRRRGIGDAAPPFRWAAGAVVAIAFAAHLGLEGLRWNLFGVYAFALAAIAAELASTLRRTVRGPLAPRARSSAARRALAVVGGIGLALSTVPAIVLPVPRLPAPTGPWSVGTTSIEYDVTSSSSVATAESVSVERVRARLWYPTKVGPVGGRSAPSRFASDTGGWLEHVDVMLPALGRRAGLPGWMMGHLAHTRVHAVWDVPVGGEGPLGVVTFDHGRGGFAAQNTFLAEELASHGWLVVAPEHPGGAILSVFRDGTAVPFDAGSFGEGLDGVAYRARIRELGLRWAEETRAALDALEAGSGPAGLAQRIDRSRLVVTGHSTGGGSAFAVCEREPGCRAVVGLDPWMLPAPPVLFDPDAGSGLSVRVVGLFSDFALGFFEPVNFEAFERLATAVETAGGQASYEIYTGAGHMDFADVGLLSPIASRLGLAVGPAGPRTVLPRVRSDVVEVLIEVDAPAVAATNRD